jgi:hypothetical protein
MAALTVKDRIEAKGERQLAYVQVARADEAIAVSDAGTGMLGTAL